MRALCAASLAIALASGFVGCGSGQSSPDASTIAADVAQPGEDARPPVYDACCVEPRPDAAELPGLDAASAGLDAAPAGLDAGSPAGPDAFVALDYDAGPKPCSFNTECPPNERCDDPAFVCMIGPRGNGKTGVDYCNSGNDCEGAICAGGWPEGAMYCSGECGGDAGTCGGQLTVCMNVPTIGVMCVRNQDGGR
ncbi:MAG TPA: hypothetical protein VGK67_39175 [Myxococcales bacterium]|jgi:hypothetical protein